MRSVKEQTRLNRADERQPRPSVASGTHRPPAEDEADDSLHALEDLPSPVRKGFSLRGTARDASTLARLNGGPPSRGNRQRVSFGQY